MRIQQSCCQEWHWIRINSNATLASFALVTASLTTIANTHEPTRLFGTETLGDLPSLVDETPNDRIARS
ncbi:MAG: hypothetical protein U5L98_17185 [Halomonas sp.]|uniref:hypothetical protein n=1 Tax=Halomonas sp. TaxID=1486246 RepID=UPI002ACDE704|nr:hypothetical protein [Halomonas sp.]MDZ7854309.1 hypothetical protein [Halomonas sp.]